MVDLGRATVRHSALAAPMRDGTVLRADAWTPAGGGRWPALVQRLPYGRAVASTPVLPHPEWFARRGYAVVVVDVRGRGDSEGRFDPYTDLVHDGVDTIEWAATLPFCDGRVATYGFSYQGLDQLAPAAERPAPLRAIAPMMCSTEPYEHWTYEHGCLRWDFVTFWSGQLAGQEPGAPVVVADREALPIARAFGDEPPTWFAEWLAHPGDDEYWAARRPDLAAIDVPVFTVLGYFDDFAAGTDRLLRELGADGVCGPWQHMPWGTRLGGVELGPAAGPGVAHAALLGFFERVFEREPAAGGGVVYYDNGRGWCSTPAWPPASEPTWWTARSVDGANSRHGDGELVPGRDESDLADVLVAEPLVPYPGAGAGLSDESAAEDRRDVLCYTASAVDTELSLAGTFEVTMTLAADAPTHDVVVSVVVVGGDGVSRRLCTRSLRWAGPADTWHDVALEVGPVAWTLLPGERLRVDVSASRFPAYDRNPQSADRPVATTPRAGYRVATILVRSLRVAVPVVAPRA